MLNRMNFVYRIAIFTVITIATLATFTSSQAGELGLGIGMISYQAPIKGVDTATEPLPFIYYEGDRLSLNLGLVSYRLNNNDRSQLAVLGQLRTQGYNPKGNDALKGMEKRDLSFDVGGSFSQINDWGIVSLSAVTDALNKHNGQEISLSYKAPFFSKKWLLEPVMGMRWQSKKLVDYYYGVLPSEARKNRPAYQGLSALSSYAGLTAAYQFTQHWVLLGDITYAYLGKNIRNSPVIDQDYEAGGSLSFLYVF